LQKIKIKRKLLLLSTALLAALSVSLALGYSPHGGQVSDSFLVSGEAVSLTARVADRDSTKIYLTSVIITDCAAYPQQNIHIKDKLTIKYDELNSEENELKIGQYVSLEGVFTQYSHASNTGEFDTAEYYRCLNIGGQLSAVSVRGRSESFSHIREKLFDIRQSCIARLYEVFPEKEAGIMSRILLGDKSGLDDDVEEMYKRNGIIHTLSISGLHITLIGMSIYRLLRKAGFPVWLSALTGGVLLVMYGIMTGMAVSVCRAIGMYIIRVLSLAIRRTYDMLTAMGVMAVILVCVNPLYLKHAGFLLSFASIAGVGIIFPVFTEGDEEEAAEKRYEPSKLRRAVIEQAGEILGGMRETALAGLSITLMTAPVQLWFYYEIPVYSVLINILVIPFMSVLLISGFAVMLVPGTGIIGTIDCMILKGYELLCTFFEKLPHGTWNPGRPKAVMIAAYYILLAAAVCCIYTDKKIKKRIISTALIVVSFICLSAHGSYESSVTFLDVGQGDGIVVRTDKGGVYIFDCGSSSRSSVGKYVLRQYLKYYGISRVDAVVVSHSDTDHCNGITEMLENSDEWGIAVDNIIIPDVKGEDFDSILSYADYANIMYINSGDGWNDGNLCFYCLHPPEGMEGEDSNALSACFLVRLDGVNILLTGDVEGEGEQLLLQELKDTGIADVDILKAAHHGSKYSTSQELLKQISPRLTVISCGKNNRYGHPHEETLERLYDVGSAVLCTKDSGAVTVEIKGGDTLVETYK
jgi:competence protein ComEC